MTSISMPWHESKWKEKNKNTQENKFTGLLFELIIRTVNVNKNLFRGYNDRQTNTFYHKMAFKQA